MLNARLTMKVAEAGRCRWLIVWLAQPSLAGLVGWLAGWLDVCVPGEGLLAGMYSVTKGRIPDRQKAGGEKWSVF